MPCQIRYTQQVMFRIRSGFPLARGGYQARWRSEGQRRHQGPKLTDEEPLLYPDSPSTHHSDLATFLAHAKRSGLNEKSTVYVGTHYEYTVAAAVSKYGFALRRVGGASDHGTDLIGTWALPTLSRPWRTLVQCKGGAAQKVGPQHVRELEGAFVGAPVGWRGHGVLGMLVSERAATKGVRDSLGRSRWPMAYVCCSKGGTVKQMLWNQQAEDGGLAGYAVAPKYAADGKEPELVLLHNGNIVPPKQAT
ncbi:conserved fungal protein [Drechmeria coniospora]|uniref:Conserved fungal protein n=1 Tax=Drechmeria coniospora TaxID=98403 RepID=A0A151GQ83_DRECN|nr:conserved fungal protein [Drechmeria coniospora]KYK59256.1 conserved fungal protein [Drechmeria coniospora]